MATFTPAYSGGIPTVEDTTQVDSDSPFADEEQGMHDGRGGHEPSTTERLACDRCRRRKIKCDRVHPCAHCIKAKLQCTYDQGQKKRPRRQRVMISSGYESRMDEINQKIDDLTDMMSRFSPAHASIGDAISANSPHPPPSPWPQSTLTQPPRTNFQVHERENNQTLTEADAIEPSLFSQAVFATKFLQAVLAHDIFSPVAPEMASALKSLGDIVEAQQRRNNSYDASNPFSKTLPLGYTIRDLPLPPIGKIMACLRLAKENSRVQSHFLLQFKSLGHFTEYVVKACSPGPMTDAELIIVHLGLYWLFYECSGVSTDISTKHDYAAQASVCKNSLEIVLSNLSFHAPTTVDYVHAMYIAAMYCLQMNKPNAGWAFVSKASLLAQAMGMHSSTTMNSEVTEEKQYKTRLFWGLYCLEKAIALRLGRSSTIRDHDITLPQPLREQRTSPDWFASLPDGIELSRLFGLVFDELFSSSALVQPTSVRRSRAKVLSAKMEQRIASRAVSDMHLEPLGQLIEPKVVAFLRHSNIVCDYSILASIYKSIPPEDTFSSSCPECVSAARTALQEHATCISLIADQASEDLILDFWINTSLLLSPFIPFNILFCNIIETCESSDLELLARFVGALELASTIPRYSAACRKQLPIFKSLYDVAAKYIEAKAKVYQQQSSTSSTTTGLGMATAEVSQSVLARTKQSDMPKDTSQDDMNDRPDDFGVEMDLSSVELGDWFYQNQQMMRLLEDG
ncbi:Zn(2)-C6 fungal-type domain-containing protein [Fusarium sp. LHS14.1]|nr:Zn(2)-C6 fungal-type domain-containing protein [Fusarium sp. LHS14.1]